MGKAGVDFRGKVKRYLCIQGVPSIVLVIFTISARDIQGISRGLMFGKKESRNAVVLFFLKTIAILYKFGFLVRYS